MFILFQYSPHWYWFLYCMNNLSNYIFICGLQYQFNTDYKNSHLITDVWYVVRHITCCSLCPFLTEEENLWSMPSGKMESMGYHIWLHHQYYFFVIQFNTGITGIFIILIQINLSPMNCIHIGIVTNTIFLSLRITWFLTFIPLYISYLTLLYFNFDELSIIISWVFG